MYIMKRYRMIVSKKGYKETKWFRAVNPGSLVGEARDMIRADYTIDKITILDSYDNIVEVVK